MTAFLSPARLLLAGTAALFLFLALPSSASLMVTTSSQQGTLPLAPDWTPAPGSLIQDAAPAIFSGNFSLEAAGRSVHSLTSGKSLTIGEIPGNTTTTNYVTCGNSRGAGALLVYTLPASADGYDITNITVYGGWKDNGRDQQAYTVSYATVDSPDSFIVLTTVQYNPSVPTGTASATRAILSDSIGRSFASHVAALKFDFASTASENGYGGYGAITVDGFPSFPSTNPPMANLPTVSPPSAALGMPAGVVVTLAATASGAKPLGFQWRTDGGSGGALTNLAGASGTNLVVDTAALAHGTYRFDAVVTNALGANISPTVSIPIVKMISVGASAPVPGTSDVSQLLNSSQDNDGLNYYTDNGPSYGRWCGQTFTTGPSLGGYLLKTFAWKSAGDGRDFNANQPYYLRFYSLTENHQLATLIASYHATGGGSEQHWFQWEGLNVPLGPNQTYAYTLGRDPSGSGWQQIGNQGGNPYAQGQLMKLSHTNGTGPITYGDTGNSDASFHLGMVPYSHWAPRALLPAFTTGAWPVYSGTTGAVTLAQTPLGRPPFTYQWLRGAGAGGALNAIAGATGPNLVADLETLRPGKYRFAVLVSNAYGSSLSPAFHLDAIGPSAPVIATDISPAPVLAGEVGATAVFAVTFTGTPPIRYQWYRNRSYGFEPIPAEENPTTTRSTLTIPHLQWKDDAVYQVVAWNSTGSVTSQPSTLVVMPPSATRLPPLRR